MHDGDTMQKCVQDGKTMQAAVMKRQQNARGEGPA